MRDKSKAADFWELRQEASNFTTKLRGHRLSQTNSCRGGEPITSGMKVPVTSDKILAFRQKKKKKKKLCNAFINVSFNIQGKITQYPLGKFSLLKLMWLQ